MSGCVQEAADTTGGDGSASTQLPDFNEVPDVSYSECLSMIKQTNPDMSDQTAEDNCHAIEALNTNDVSHCNQIVDSAIKNACLAQFQ